MSPENNLMLQEQEIKMTKVLKHFDINPEIDEVPGTWIEPGTIICVKYQDDDNPLWLCVLPPNHMATDFTPINCGNMKIYPISPDTPLIREIGREMNPRSIPNGIKMTISLQIENGQTSVNILKIIRPNKNF